MRVDRSWVPSYLDVDHNFQLKPVALLRELEKTAIRHTDMVGLHAKELYDRQGLAWIMHKIGLRIHHMPVYGQELTVRTWSKGIKGFRALREFEIREEDRILVSATSLWLLYDLNQERLKRIPEEMARAYEIETWRHALELDLGKWKPGAEFPVQTCIPITTRGSDLDIYGHVNHAVYLDYIDTALARSGDAHTWLGDLRLAIFKEISSRVEKIEVQLGPGQEARKVRISQADTVFALAERDPSPKPGPGPSCSVCF